MAHRSRSAESGQTAKPGQDDEVGQVADPGMGTRGVTRPMALGGGHSGDGEHADGHGPLYGDARRAMQRTHHAHTLWIPWTLILLGIWTALAPLSFGHLVSASWVDPAGGRGVWFDDAPHTALRALLMTWSDVLCGAALVVTGWRALTPDRPVSRWIACGVGAWLCTAPVVFWAPTAASYANDTLVGMLVIALTVLVPGMPNMPLYMRMGGTVPPGWSYDPSSWPQRSIMIATAFVGFLASRQLAVYQLGYTDRVWEPFFGDGSRQVLESRMSRSLPVSDAALGTLAYTFEFLMGWMGSAGRWRTMPWMVTFFGILVIPLGLVHVFLVVSQPVVVGQWCTLCLVAAAVMLPMIPLQADEVVAMLQHVAGGKRRGERLWTVFWKGGDPVGSAEDRRTPDLRELPRAPRRVLAATVWGFTTPWTLVTATGLGVFVMALPGLAAVEGSAASVHHIAGALAVVVAVVSMGEVVRAARFLAVPVGLWIAVASWLLPGASTGAALAATVAGVLIAGLSLPRGAVRDRYGTWDRWIDPHRP